MRVLAGKTAIVTAAAQGIGRSAAELFASAVAWALSQSFHLW
ncbi:hypothetical protein [Brucella grignonensis]|uniref:Uncharacterized protein n=1 Tax=Brucella grignonensis TaxID=94627 RepID=A0A256F0P0_9HYPH|nr:hypothetical protein [Brucella grignonensis]OYR08424.1 hypothetical protein CEV33_3189 [Brucella grignonensis]